MAATGTISYDEMLTDIKESLGFVPGFMAAVPEEALVHEWQVFKQYTLGETVIPPKYREMKELAVAAATKCPYCQALHRARPNSRERPRKNWRKSASWRDRPHGRAR